MSNNYKKPDQLTNYSHQTNYFDSHYDQSEIGFSKFTSSSNFKSNFTNNRPENYIDQNFNNLTNESSSFRSVSTPPSVMSLPTRLEKTNRSILAVFRLCFFLAFWIIVGCVVAAFGKDVLNRLEQEREQKRFEVDLCLNDFKSKLDKIVF